MFSLRSSFPSSCHLLSHWTQPLLSLSYLFIFLQSLRYLFATLSDSSSHTQSPTQYYIKKEEDFYQRLETSFFWFCLLFSAALSGFLVLSFSLFHPHLLHFHTRHSALSHPLVCIQHLSLCWVFPLNQSHLPI